MDLENKIINSEENKSIKAENEAYLEVEKSPEDTKREMLKNAEEEVSDFNKNGEDELEKVEKKALVDGLEIDAKDRSELKGLNQEAEEAEGELKQKVLGTEQNNKEQETALNQEDGRRDVNLGREKIHRMYTSGKNKSLEYKELYQLLINQEDNSWKADNEVDTLKLEAVLKKIEEKDVVKKIPEIPKRPIKIDEKKLVENEIEEKAVSMMKERVIKKPELLNKEISSKKFLAEERSKLIKEIKRKRQQRKEMLMNLESALPLSGMSSEKQKARLLDLENKIKELESSPEKLKGSKGDKQYGELNKRQSVEADVMKERFLSGEELSKENAKKEQENLEQLIANSKGIKGIRKKVEEHYAKADEIAKKEFESMQKTVEQTMIRNNVFLVHSFLTNDKLRHNANSNVSQRATLKDDIDILLSLEPSISTSSVVPGAKQGLWENNIGVVLGGGDIQGVRPTDDGTVSGGIKHRSGQISNAEKIDENVADKEERSYNELVVNNPKVFGFFKNVFIDKDGRMLGFNPEYRKKDDFMQYINLAKEKGMPPLIMTPDRKLFEFIGISDEGVVSVGQEITPEQVAKGKAGLVEKKRKELGEKVIAKNLFNRIGHQKEAKKIVAELAGKEEAEAEFSREDYLSYAQDNKGNINNFPAYLLDDIKFMKEAAKANPRNVYMNASEKLKNNVDFIKYLYSIGKKDVDLSLYSQMPEKLKGEESIALLAIENNDIEDINVAFADSPRVWGKIVDKMVEKENPDKWFSRGVGEEQITSLYVAMRKKREIVDVTDKLMTDESFVRKLNDEYPKYTFKVNEYKQLAIKKMI